MLLFYCSTNDRPLRLTKKAARRCGEPKEKPFLSDDSDGFCQGCYQTSASVRARASRRAVSGAGPLRFQASLTLLFPLLSNAPRHSQHRAPDGRCQIPLYPVSSLSYEYLQSGGVFTVFRCCGSCKISLSCISIQK